MAVQGRARLGGELPDSNMNPVFATAILDRARARMGEGGPGYAAMGWGSIDGRAPDTATDIPTWAYYHIDVYVYPVPERATMLHAASTQGTSERLG